METPSAQSVVVGVDRSQPSATALDWAADEAVRRDSELHIVHFVSAGAAHRPSRNRREAEDDRTSAQEFLEEAARKVQQSRAGLLVTWDVLSGEPAPGLIELGEHAALEVVGARGLNRFAALLLGSVSQRLVAHAACPVVVVRSGLPAAEASPDGPVIVLGAAPGEPSGVVWFAFAEAARWRAPLRVVRAWAYPQTYPGYISVAQDEAEQRDAEEGRELMDVLAAARHAYPGVTVVEDISLAEPEEALVGASRGAHLVVVGARRKRPPLSMPLGPVTQRVLQHAHCPVAVVPV